VIVDAKDEGERGQQHVVGSSDVKTKCCDSVGIFLGVVGEETAVILKLSLLVGPSPGNRRIQAAALS